MALKQAQLLRAGTVVGEGEGFSEGAGVGASTGASDGWDVTVGACECVGLIVGDPVGAFVGAGVGSPEHVTWSWARTNKNEVARRRTRGMVKAW